MASNVEIKLLPKSLQDALSAGVNIRSASHCISELVMNSLDAKSTSIAVRVNLITYNFHIIDNGYGISKKNMKLVGCRYATSKYFSIKDLQKGLNVFGSRGQALANIIKLSKKLTITSKYSENSKTYCKTFENGKSSIITPPKNRPGTGTTIIVENFMYNLPVRKNHANKVACLDDIKHTLECIALIHPHTSFSLRNNAVGETIFYTCKTKYVYQIATMLYGKHFSKYLRKISHKSANINIHGLISIQTHVHNKLQFLYLNNRHVAKSKIYTFINTQLAKSDIFHRDQNKFSAFILNIKCSHSEIDVVDYADMIVEFKDWDKILSCVQQALETFLKEEGLLTKPQRESNNLLNGSPISPEPATVRVSQVAEVIRGLPVKRKPDNAASIQQEEKRNNQSIRELSNESRCEKTNDEAILELPAKKKCNSNALNQHENYAISNISQEKPYAKNERKMKPGVVEKSPDEKKCDVSNEQENQIVNDVPQGSSSTKDELKKTNTEIIQLLLDKKPNNSASNQDKNRGVSDVLEKSAKVKEAQEKNPDLIQQLLVDKKCHNRASSRDGNGGVGDIPQKCTNKKLQKTKVKETQELTFEKKPVIVPNQDKNQEINNLPQEDMCAENKLTKKKSDITRRLLIKRKFDGFIPNECENQPVGDISKNICKNCKLQQPKRRIFRELPVKKKVNITNQADKLPVNFVVQNNAVENQNSLNDCNQEENLLVEEYLKSRKVQKTAPSIDNNSKNGKEMILETFLKSTKVFTENMENIDTASEFKTSLTPKHKAKNCNEINKHQKKIIENTLQNYQKKSAVRHSIQRHRGYTTISLKDTTVFPKTKILQNVSQKSTNFPESNIQRENFLENATCFSRSKMYLENTSCPRRNTQPEISQRVKNLPETYILPEMPLENVANFFETSTIQKQFLNSINCFESNTLPEASTTDNTNKTNAPWKTFQETTNIPEESVLPQQFLTSTSNFSKPNKLPRQKYRVSHYKYTIQRHKPIKSHLNAMRSSEFLRPGLKFHVNEKKPQKNLQVSKKIVYVNSFVKSWLDTKHKTLNSVVYYNNDGNKSDHCPWNQISHMNNNVPSNFMSVPKFDKSNCTTNNRNGDMSRFTMGDPNQNHPFHNNSLMSLPRKSGREENFRYISENRLELVNKANVSNTLCERKKTLSIPGNDNFSGINYNLNDTDMSKRLPDRQKHLCTSKRNYIATESSEISENSSIIKSLRPEENLYVSKNNFTANHSDFRNVSVSEPPCREEDREYIPENYKFIRCNRYLDGTVNVSKLPKVETGNLRVLDNNRIDLDNLELPENADINNETLSFVSVLSCCQIETQNLKKYNDTKMQRDIPSKMFSNSVFQHLSETRIPKENSIAVDKNPKTATPSNLVSEMRHKNFSEEKAGQNNSHVHTQTNEAQNAVSEPQNDYSFLMPNHEDFLNFKKLSSTEMNDSKRNLPVHTPLPYSIEFNIPYGNFTPSSRITVETFNSHPAQTLRNEQPITSEFLNSVQDTARNSHVKRPNTSANKPTLNNQMNPSLHSIDFVLKPQFINYTPKNPELNPLLNLNNRKYTHHTSPYFHQILSEAVSNKQNSKNCGIELPNSSGRISHHLQNVGEHDQEFLYPERPIFEKANVDQKRKHCENKEENLKYNTAKTIADYCSKVSNHNSESPYYEDVISEKTNEDQKRRHENKEENLKYNRSANKKSNHCRKIQTKLEIPYHEDVIYEEADEEQNKEDSKKEARHTKNHRKKSFQPSPYFEQTLYEKPAKDQNDKNTQQNLEPNSYQTLKPQKFLKINQEKSPVQISPYFKLMPFEDTSKNRNKENGKIKSKQVGCNTFDKSKRHQHLQRKSHKKNLVHKSLTFEQTSVGNEITNPAKESCENNSEYLNINCTKDIIPHQFLKMTSHTKNSTEKSPYFNQVLFKNAVDSQNNKNCKNELQNLKPNNSNIYTSHQLLALCTKKNSFEASPYFQQNSNARAAEKQNNENDESEITDVIADKNGTNSNDSPRDLSAVFNKQSLISITIPDTLENINDNNLQAINKTQNKRTDIVSKTALKKSVPFEKESDNHGIKNASAENKSNKAQYEVVISKIKNLHEDFSDVSTLIRNDIDETEPKNCINDNTNLTKVINILENKDMNFSELHTSLHNTKFEFIRNWIDNNFSDARDDQTIFSLAESLVSDRLNRTIQNFLDISLSPSDDIQQKDNTRHKSDETLQTNDGRCSNYNGKSHLSLDKSEKHDKNQPPCYLPGLNDYDRQQSRCEFENPHLVKPGSESENIDYLQIKPAKKRAKLEENCKNMQSEFADLKRPLPLEDTRLKDDTQFEKQYKDNTNNAEKENVQTNYVDGNAQVNSLEGKAKMNNLEEKGRANNLEEGTDTIQLLYSLSGTELFNSSQKPHELEILESPSLLSKSKIAKYSTNNHLLTSKNHNQLKDILKHEPHKLVDSQKMLTLSGHLQGNHGIEKSIRNDEHKTQTNTSKGKSNKNSQNFSLFKTKDFSSDPKTQEFKKVSHLTNLDKLKTAGNTNTDTPVSLMKRHSEYNEITRIIQNKCEDLDASFLHTEHREPKDHYKEKNQKNSPKHTHLQEDININARDERNVNSCKEIYVDAQEEKAQRKNPIKESHENFSYSLSDTKINDSNQKTQPKTDRFKTTLKDNNAFSTKRIKYNNYCQEKVYRKNSQEETNKNVHMNVPEESHKNCRLIYSGSAEISNLNQNTDHCKTGNSGLTPKITNKLETAPENFDDPSKGGTKYDEIQKIIEPLSFENPCRILSQSADTTDLKRKNDDSSVQFNKNKKLECDNSTARVEPENETIEWTKHTFDDGTCYHLNSRTGMTSFETPKVLATYSMTKRHAFVPKGMSPVLYPTKRKNKELSPTSKKLLHETLTRNETDELRTVKWMKYFQDQDSEKFFADLYSEKKYYEKEIPNLSEQRLSKKIMGGFENYKFSTDIFENITFISQWDNKFLVTKVVVDNKFDIIALFDQHAVHERICLEKLLKDYEKEDGILKSTKCISPILVTLNNYEVQMLQTYRNSFENWGFSYQIKDKHNVTFTHIPLCWKTNENSQVNKQNHSTESRILELIQEESVWLRNFKKIDHSLPLAVQNVVKMEACRSAIKFGDSLTENQCIELLEQLSTCDLPFQCAHGRPTVAPIFDLKKMPNSTKEQKINFKTLNNKQ